MPAFPKPTATETDPVAGPNLTTHTALTTTAHGGIVASDDARLTNAPPGPPPPVYAPQTRSSPAAWPPSSFPPTR